MPPRVTGQMAGAYGTARFAEGTARLQGTGKLGGTARGGFDSLASSTAG
jgi:hypothetical protein